MTSQPTQQNTANKTGRVRPAAVAGLFYPERPAELAGMVESLLANAPTAEGVVPKALIAPHAGYPFSGPVAAHAYATLRQARELIRRVVLLGPAHRVYLRGLALPGADRFDTPLGAVELDQEGVDRLRHLPSIRDMPEAHHQEHSLEVQLPFLQCCLADFRLIPLVVGDAAPEEVAGVLDLFWDDDETLILISSDLSHYHDYETAVTADADTVERIRKLELEAIGPNQACGCMPIRGLLHQIRKRSLMIETLDVRNSGDTAGPRDRVVGYGSFAVYPEPGFVKSQQRVVHEIAHDSIRNGLRTGEPLRPDIQEYPGLLGEKRGTFVTLRLNGRLRGCIGNTEAHLPLVQAVADSAFAAAFRDPRFPSLTDEEFRHIDIHISVLSPCREMVFASEQELLQRVRPGIHGVTIAVGKTKATFLPSVWEDLPDPEQFFLRLKQKAGIPADAVPERAWVYTAESF